MISTQTLKGNLINQDYSTAFTLNQGDKGVPFRVELLENGTPYTLLSDDIVTIEWLKPNGNPFLQEGDIKYGTNYIEFTTPEAVAQFSGSGTFNIIITNNNVRKGTIRREYKVVPTSMKLGSISEDVITDAITELRELSVEIADTVQNNQDLINNNQVATQGQVNTINTNLDSINTNIKTINTNINSINSSLEEKANKTDVNDKFSKVNSSLEEKANKDEFNIKIIKNATDIATQSARIDALSSLSSGSTTGDAELIDSRVNDIGETYSSVGTCIRSTISDVRRLSTTSDIVTDYELGGLDVTSGVNSDNNARIRSKLTYAPSGTTIKSINGYSFWIAIFNTNGEYVKITDLWINNYIFNENCMYRICVKLDGDGDLSDNLSTINNNILIYTPVNYSIDKYNDNINKLYNIHNNSNDLIIYNKSDFKNVKGLVIKTDAIKKELDVIGNSSNGSVILLDNVSVELTKGETYTLFFKNDYDYGDSPLFVGIYDTSNNRVWNGDAINTQKENSFTFVNSKPTGKYYLGFNSRKNQNVKIKTYVGLVKGNDYLTKYDFLTINEAKELENKITTIETGINDDIEIIKNYVSTIGNIETIDNSCCVKISDFLNDSKTDSECIEDAIDFVRSFDKKTIIFDTNVTINKVILLPDNTTVKLINCTITQEDEMFDNVFRGENVLLKDDDYYYVPSDIKTLKNIKIIGDGNSKIIGCTVNKKYTDGTTMTGDGWGGRTHQINMSCVDGFELCGLEFSKTRGWCIELEFVKNFYVHDLVFNTVGVENADGLDVRAGCKFGRIENLSGTTGDDTIAFNTHIKPDLTYPISSHYKFPNEYTYLYNNNLCETDARAGDISNIVCENISKTNGSCHLAVFLAMYGHRITNISMNNININGNIGLPWTNSYIAFYNYIGNDAPLGDSTSRPPSTAFTKGDISNIRINNVISNCNTNGSILFSNCELKNVFANNLVQENTSANITTINQDGFKLTNSKIGS